MTAWCRQQALRSDSNALARPNDSMTSTASVALRLKRARQAQWQHDVDSKRCAQTALARPNDSMTSTASVALRQRSSFLFKDLQLACTSRDFRVQFFCDVRDMRRLTMSGHKARKPDTPKSVKKNRVSAFTKSVDRDHSEKCVPPKTIAREIGRAPSNVYTLPCIAINR